jgi:hypothetical protein
MIATAAAWALFRRAIKKKLFVLREMEVKIALACKMSQKNWPCNHKWRTWYKWEIVVFLALATQCDVASAVFLEPGAFSS